MKAHVLPIIALVLLSIPANAQLTAGEVPSGMSALDLNIDITLLTPLTTDSAALELDCDDFWDAMAVLQRGYPAVDAPNTAALHFMDSDLELCANMAPSFQRRPKYYSFGQPLDCAGDFEWQFAGGITLGDLGGFMATGPASIDSLYIAYRRGPTVGWIQLSFDVNDGPPVYLRIHRVLAVCPSSTAVPQNEALEPLLLFPNPGDGGPVRVQNAEALRAIDVFDAAGRCVARYSGNLRSFAPPEVAGTYLVRALYADGQRSTVRWVKY
jgi:hypothetical protein